MMGSSGVSMRGKGFEDPSVVTSSGHDLTQNTKESFKNGDELEVSPLKGGGSSPSSSRNDFGNYGVMVIVSEAKAYEPSWKNRLHNLNDNLISSLASSHFLGSEKRGSPPSDTEGNEMMTTTKNQLQSTTSLSSVLHAIDDILRLASSKLDLSFDIQQSLGDISTAVQNTKKSVKVAEGGKISEEEREGRSVEEDGGGSSPHVCFTIYLYPSIGLIDFWIDFELILGCCRGVLIPSSLP